MTDMVEPEVLFVRREPFARCVIFDGRNPDEPRFWDGKDWTADLQKAMLFADGDTLDCELRTIQRKS